jgi:chromosome partitioning protein
MLISFPNDKGGAGKTTACLCLACAYASQHERVHIIDTDTNATATRWLTGRQDARNLITTEPVATSIEGVTLTRPPIGQLVAHLKALHATGSYDHILIDLPGTREAANLKAMLVSDLVIIPAAPQEGSYDGAVNAITDLTDMVTNTGRSIPYRILLTQVKAIGPAAQARIISEIAAAGLPRFQTVLTVRAPYEEIGLTGKPPHAADPAREAVHKARLEVAALVSEIDALMAAQPQPAAKVA